PVQNLKRVLRRVPRVRVCQDRLQGRAERVLLVEQREEVDDLPIEPARVQYRSALVAGADQRLEDLPGQEELAERAVHEGEVPSPALAPEERGGLHLSDDVIDLLVPQLEPADELG